MKFFFVFALALLLSECNTPEKRTAASTATDSLINNPGSEADSAYAGGARLIAENDCLTCHRIDSQNIGPAYDSIAMRYQFIEGNVENLAHSIIHGSKGLWGNKEMTPHPNLSYNDAKEMARYILSLRNTRERNNQ